MIHEKPYQLMLNNHEVFLGINPGNLIKQIRYCLILTKYTFLNKIMYILCLDVSYSFFFSSMADLSLCCFYFLGSKFYNSIRYTTKLFFIVYTKHKNYHEIKLMKFLIYIHKHKNRTFNKSFGSRSKWIISLMVDKWVQELLGVCCLKASYPHRSSFVALKLV